MQLPAWNKAQRRLWGRKMNIFIIHGAYGNPEENWFPWLKKELEQLGHTITIPTFPTPENQTLDTWMKIFEPYMDKIDEKTIFVGHSLAPSFILSVLERIDVQVKACFFIAGFIGALGNDQFDPINASFTEKRFDWGKIKNNCDQFILYVSDNDPYIPLETGKELAEKLQGELHIIKNAGHINKDAGYTEFPQLLEEIKKIK